MLTHMELKACVKPNKVLIILKCEKKIVSMIQLCDMGFQVVMVKKGIQVITLDWKVYASVKACCGLRYLVMKGRVLNLEQVYLSNILKVKSMDVIVAHNVFGHKCKALLKKPCDTLRIEVVGTSKG